MHTRIILLQYFQLIQILTTDFNEFESFSSLS